MMRIMMRSGMATSTTTTCYTTPHHRSVMTFRKSSPSRYCCPSSWMVLFCWYGPVLARGLSSSSSSSSSSSITPLPLPLLPTLNHHNHNIHDHLPLARQAMSYFDASPDPFHAVQTSIDLLQQAGFTEWDDSDSTTTTSSIIIKPGDKYYFTRNKSTLVAFHVGRHYQPGHGGFVMIGGHTDSPNLKVKTRSKRGSSSSSSSSSGSLIQIGVECYGGGLWHTWFDRDLGISGRVMIQRHDDNSHQRRIEQRLMKIDRAVLRISNLAIHLRTEEERKAFAINKEDHLSPILAMAALKALTTTTTTTTGDGEVTTLKAGDSVEEENDKDTEKMKEDDDDKHKKTNSHTITKKDGWTEHQEPILLQLLATELQVAVEDIIDFELNLFDVQKASLGGASGEFIYSARLDNLASCFLAVQALVEHALEEDEKEGEQSEGAKDIAMIVLYDHEEVGSGSAVGAASPIMREAVERISAALNGGVISPDLYQSTIRKSFVLSSDQAHAVHPNYASKHEKAHQPKMNQGMVIKRNSNQRYATNGITGLLIREVARRANLPPVQEFMVRQDCGCGSTIGPLISTATGIRAIDMGCPQLSMHSIRETMGVCDLTHGLALFKAYFKYFREVDSSVEQ